MAPKQEVANEIAAYITKCGGRFGAWYVGITRDVRQRLFAEHGVNEKYDAWIFSRAASSADAREIERYFLTARGTDGGGGGGDYTCTIVYAYRKNAHTRP